MARQLVDTLRTKAAKEVFAKYPDKRSAIMPLLYIAQEEYGWVSPVGINEVAALCEIDPTQVKSIAGFYTMYRESPKGRYWLQVCTDLPCALRGADKFYKDLLTSLEVEDGVVAARLAVAADRLNDPLRAAGDRRRLLLRAGKHEQAGTGGQLRALPSRQPEGGLDGGQALPEK